MPLNEAQAQLLTLLVMDFHYDHQPAYGHAPIRHQKAWVYATKGLTPDEVAAEVADRKASLKTDPEGNAEVRANYEELRHFDPAEL